MIFSSQARNSNVLEPFPLGSVVATLLISVGYVLKFVLNFVPTIVLAVINCYAAFLDCP